MYSLSRWCLSFFVLGVGLCLVMVTTLAWPASGLLLGVFVCARFLKGRRCELTTLGSAKWAGEGDLSSKGMLPGSSGLLLGRLVGSKVPSWYRAATGLFRDGIDARRVCLSFWRAVFRRPEEQLVRLPHAIHTAVVSPSGGGKGVGCVIPFLLTCPDSCVVLDFKGENALATAIHRSTRFGHKVVLLDPFRVVTKKPDSYNPLTGIAKDDPLALDACNALANALVVSTGEEKEPHWNQMAEAVIAANLANVICYGDSENKMRSLQTMRDLVGRPERLETSIQLMTESDAYGGMLARAGSQLKYLVDKEKSSVLTTVGRHLKFLDTPAIAESTATSTFDPAELRNGKMTIYLILPPEHMRPQMGLLRMWITSFLREIVRGGLQEKNKVYFVLDEAASLGHLEAIDDAIDKYRGYGVRLMLIFQSLGQLKKNFPNGGDQTLLSNTTQVFFGVNDLPTAEYVSSRLGEKTIIVASGGSSKGTSSQSSDGVQAQTTRGSSDNLNDNWAQQTRKLLKPEEILALSPRTAITFTPGVPPIRTTLMRYYEEPALGGRRMKDYEGLCKLGVTVGSVLLGIGGIMLASMTACFFLSAFRQ